jgi:predicted branched-subunit amino acid permease
LLWVVWQTAELAGILAGQMIPASWQLYFVVPLCFLAVLAPLLRDRVSLLVVAVTATTAIALDAMPMHLSMICAGLIGIAAGAFADALRGQHE